MERMKCEDVDKLKPLDRLLDDQIKEFGSGRDRVCDKDLDTMMWELGDYENEEPKMEAGEFEGDTPIEENLVERKMIHGSNAQPYYIDDIATAHSLSPETRRRKATSVRRKSPVKKKK